MEILKLQNYHFKYFSETDFSISNINITLNTGEFIVLFGKSGAGKTTLLRSMKKELRKTGRYIGEVVSNIKESEISIVFQNPNTQLINNRVIDDLVFHMENLNYSVLEMKRRLSETVYYFGIEDILHKDPEELSGGQRQIVALCSALMVRPKLLLLDEPTSQLDPISTRNFFGILEKINTDFDVTIVMTEHKLDEAMKYSDKLVFMENGKIIEIGKNKEVITKILEENINSSSFIPSIPRVSYKIFKEISYTPKEIKKKLYNVNIRYMEVKEKIYSGVEILRLRRVFFKYLNSDYIIKNISMRIYEKERICLLGCNGSGKTTLLKLIANIYKPTFGSIRSKDIEIGYLPQDVSLYFSKDSVIEELELTFGENNINKDYLELFNIKDILKKNPRDISGGEQLKVAILSILGKDPDLIVLDEPTKGLDIYSQNEIIEIIKSINITLICSTHNLEFSCKIGTKSIMLFDGEISFSEDSRNFIKYNEYYTTQLSLAIRKTNENIILLEDIDYEN